MPLNTSTTTTMLPVIKEFYAGWVIGMLEGEGCFTNRKDGTYALELKSTDEDVAINFAKLTGAKVSGPFKPKNTKHKDYYRVYINHDTGLIQLLEMVYPFMGERRKEQIGEILRRYYAKYAGVGVIWPQQKKAH